MSSSDRALLALHGLRLKGLADTASLAALVRVEESEMEQALEALAVEDHVVFRNSHRNGWVLTPLGREHHEALLAAELEVAPGRRSAVKTVYRAFVPLNQRFLALCTRWQVRAVADGTESVNRHHDADYDQAVLDELTLIDREARPLLYGLASTLDRFEIYRSRLAHALERVNEGEPDWLASPLIDSYHTVWFELHEDLLASLGLDRATETANPQGAATPTR